jgi:hypothetical protein
MNVTATILLALAIPLVLIVLLLPPLFLQNRLQTASGEFPEGLSKALGMDRRVKVSVWDLFLFLFLLVSPFAPEAMQAWIGVASGIFVAAFAGFRAKAYLAARIEYKENLSPQASRLLLYIGVGALFFCILFLCLTITLSIK